MLDVMLLCPFLSLGCFCLYFICSWLLPYGTLKIKKKKKEQSGQPERPQLYQLTYTKSKRVISHFSPSIQY